MANSQTILVAPLNWGLGHATRVCPLIEQFLTEGSRVILAGNGASLAFLQSEFPNLESLSLKSYTIKYPYGKGLLFSVFLQMPLFWLNMVTDYLNTKRLVKKYGISQIISDNRYGCYHKKIKSILITHQVFMQMPRGLKWTESFLHWVTRDLIEKFDECWIPDFEDKEQSLAGNLSHGTALPKNCKYIGPLSRFTRLNVNPQPDGNHGTFQILVLVSGPEPFRSRYTEMILRRFSKTSEKVAFLIGKPAEFTNPDQNDDASNIKVINHVKTNDFARLMLTSCRIISVAGYSTIMDLYTLGLTAELIPTPGQIEQEYLVTWLTQQNRIIKHQTI